ncbi:META domain-containing protein [Flavobacterium hercynium]|uniref:META domain-containing protein n=1 Tax=Flavobacterium hercynium TaxID=387094 RepID=A0A226H4C5_9FLAO|nr:META domain-containing protein [Flavobacterium hercynium]OXA88718.1 META domain-containing protein [Flavobacterium hercynium]SMP34658.1 Heat shock protein HslJ [Flavobacterium hercynium]
MKKSIIAIFLLGAVMVSCNVFKCKKEASAATLAGTWELNYVTGPRIAFDGLYPNKKPVITFDLKENRVSGNSSCNSFSGQFTVDGNKVDLTQPMMMTKMMCGDGQGEQVFMSTLQKADTYAITEDGKTLNLISGDIATMRFTRK